MTQFHLCPRSQQDRQFDQIWLIISVYLSSLPVAHLSDAPRRRLVVTGDSARIQDETTEISAWFFNVLGVQHRHTGPRFNVSSERQLIILVGQPGTRTHTCRDPKHYVHKSYALPTELIGRYLTKFPEYGIKNVASAMHTNFFLNLSEHEKNFKL